MREILFRGKRVDDAEWVEGSLTVNHYDRAGKLEDEYRIVDTYYGLDDEDFPTYQSGLEEVVVPSTVGQYTGLEDRNGRKIFEGDIVAHLKFPDEPALICWHETGFAIKGLWYSTDISSRKADIKVVGNIHDNPEMIDGGQHD